MLFPLAENNEELLMPVSNYVYIMHISYWYTDVCIYRYQHRIGVTLVCIHVCETDRAWVHTQVQNCLKTDQVTLCRIPFTSLHQSIYWKFWHLTDDSPILKKYYHTDFILCDTCISLILTCTSPIKDKIWYQTYNKLKPDFTSWQANCWGTTVLSWVEADTTTDRYLSLYHSVWQHWCPGTKVFILSEVYMYILASYILCFRVQKT